MHWSLAVVAVLASHLLGVPAADTSSSRYGCGTNAPAEFLALAKSMDSTAVGVKAVAVNRTLEVKLYIHVVTTEDKEGTVTDEMVHDQVREYLFFACHSSLRLIFHGRSLINHPYQVDVLNEDYKPLNISFDLIDFEYTVDDDWAAEPYRNESDMKAKLNQGAYADLNIYFVSDLVES